MTRKLTWFTALALGISTLSQAESPPAPTTAVPSASADAPLTVPVNPAAPQDPDAPVRDVQLSFAQIAPPPGTFTLRGTRPDGQIEFGVRSDEVVSQATLDLSFTPSPSLIPVESHLKVYLNDELMGVTTIAKEQLGKPNHIEMAIDPRYITDFNRLKLVFVGHYQNICENPASSTLWLEIGKSSALKLRYQTLPLKNELSHFPEPFFDNRDNRPLTLPMVFAGQPDITQQRAAGILASWFGSKAQWRGQSFPAMFDTLPDRHAVVFATNQQRPAFLRDYPAVNGPTVEMIGHPDNPYVKLLLIQGRDDNDLVTAVKGIAQGNILFRGQNVTVDKVEQLAPRQPYDAPNWVRTDRPMTFTELQQYAEQLQTSGIEPSPISLTMNLPPDLFLIRSTGIDMRLKYRYTPPRIQDGSRLNVNLNNQFIQAYSLVPEHEQGAQLLRLPLTQGLIDSDRNVTIPALRLGAVNQLRFDFDYTTLLASGAEGRCETYSFTQNHAVIDGSSTIDFSGYRHFMAMPDLRAFANAAFPFSRLADLSQTLVLVNKQPQPAQVSALLDALGNIGAQTGYPALAVSLSDDWAQAKEKDADILMIGTIPPELRDDKKVSLLVDATESWVKQPRRQPPLPSMEVMADDSKPDSRTAIGSEGAMAAIVGVQSPFNDQRSIVALLADSPRGYQLLGNALLDSGKRAAMFGSVSVIRESGVNSLRVGDIYYVGHLPWWERVWHALSTHPVLLAVLAVIVVVILALMLWRGLKAFSRRRLSPEDRD
ncbi:cellulose biosynthesis cyclic di-GMP-binding regulatory protein BcsB [Serratia odorifera]|jgi:cellulose synthase operon protein B|uniref:Cyclic di-GMP-binding protein n=2 Tax=Serratia odorifera TaxID=618 RepID=D4DZZ6_SEROD|nr:cellulose biosynthesis cyclic di-GMP-binding regulatory protein BcsB [Serratia odorifera]EFE96902.1 bacterial cellulose synthase subunit [Serratia odorifera DSM 4582]MBJ2066297.1 cellulose biosynthesis cyclic di-GMP-binding regulatory protein BcsB [Serratia odorifera]PNK91411.1 cellulose biosynthesis cyclic di-GMP-binding regulatory protein BcsB [Serratia odorifera]RII72500.1 cellulose biosynthesis cyclic di-GMP-binding regulatory protein BcsB [Serratia odorifera]VDZ55878.1 Cellulose syntha